MAVAALDRAACRRVFEERFSARRMARDYLALYQRLLDRQPRAGDGRKRRPAVPVLPAPSRPARLEPGVQNAAVECDAGAFSPPRTLTPRQNYWPDSDPNPSAGMAGNGIRSG